MLTRTGGAHDSPHQAAAQRFESHRPRTPGQRPTTGVHAHQPPGPVREHRRHRPAPVQRAGAPRRHAAHPARAGRHREGQRAEHDAHRRRPGRARPGLPTGRPDRWPAGHPVADARGRGPTQGHAPPPRPVDGDPPAQPQRGGAGDPGPRQRDPAEGGRRMSPTFSSLSIYNYRVYFGGALVSNIGTWMGRVAQDWLVLTVLTDHDPVALGVVTGLQFAPMVLLAPWAGMIADRFAKRRILFATQSMLAITSLLTGVLVVTGVVQLWHVYLLAMLQGLATAVDSPARQTFVSEMVPRTSLANAVSLNSASFNAARIIGPGGAGLVIAAVGTGPAFFVNTLSFVAVLVALTQMKPERLRPAPRTRGKGQIRDGLRYVKGRPDIILIMVLVFVLGTFGMNFQLTTALMATQLFHKGAGEYGLLGSIMAIGSLSAALLSAPR